MSDFTLSGTITESGRILAFKEVSYDLEENQQVSAGEYSIDVTGGLKSILARNSAGNVVTYGAVVPTFTGASSTETYTSDWVEADPNGEMSVYDKFVVLEDYGRNQPAGLYKDFGVDYFDTTTDIQADFDFEWATGASGTGVSLIAFSDEYVIGYSDRSMSADNDVAVLMKAEGGGLKFQLDHNYTEGQTGTSEILDSWTCLHDISLPKHFWTTFKRVNKTFTYDIYSDSTRSTLLGTLSGTVGSNRSYRYCYAPDALYDGGDNDFSMTYCSLAISTASGTGGAQWVSRLDTNYWASLANAAWDGSKWVESGPPADMVLAVPFGSTWEEGYRPTKIRITGNQAYGGTITLSDSQSGGGNVIATGTAATTLEMDLDFSSAGDMQRLDLYGYANVTNIEFYET